MPQITLFRPEGPASWADLSAYAVPGFAPLATGEVVATGPNLTQSWSGDVPPGGNTNALAAMPVVTAQELTCEFEYGYGATVDDIFKTGGYLFLCADFFDFSLWPENAYRLTIRPESSSIVRQLPNGQAWSSGNHPAGAASDTRYRLRWQITSDGDLRARWWPVAGAEPDEWLCTATEPGVPLAGVFASSRQQFNHHPTSPLYGVSHHLRLFDIRITTEIDDDTGFVVGSYTFG